MILSFIVIGHNLEDHIGTCLDSLAPCLLPGDQLIVVDDGSSDLSCEEIMTHLLPLQSRAIETCPIFFGANTKGGVGIPANMGLQEARGDGVIFVDGKGWVDAQGILAARRRFERQPCDLLIANHRVYDTALESFESPVNQHLWRKVPAAGSRRERRHLAIQMSGVPWHKIYRLDHLRSNNIRFLEGSVFFGDDLFHLKNCLHAAKIHFFDQCVCTHRIGGLGQTMVAEGGDLTAFFDHYDRIVRDMQDESYRLDAQHWLLENMAKHIEYLAPNTYWIYACRAQETLAFITKSDWQKMRADSVVPCALGDAWALSQGHLAGVVSSWQNLKILRRIRELDTRVAQIEQAAVAQAGSLQLLTHWTEGQRELQEFRSLQALSERRS